MTELLSVENAAAALDLSKGTLDKWRVQGRGPTYIKIGSSVKYRRADLEAFIAERVRSSTTEAA